MDNDLSRSMRMLEESLSSHGKGLLVTGTPKFLERRKGARRPEKTTSAKQDYSNLTSLGNIHSIHDSMFENVVESNKSITGSIIRSKEPWKATVNSLYTEFYETLQTHTSGQEIFEVIADLGRCCSDALQVVGGMKSKTSLMQIDEETWLENERNTWRLLYVLYQDRLNSQNLNVDGEEQMSCLFFGPSEKLCILNLFKGNSILRESQLVIDWLEYSACERDIEALHFADNSSGWENTLHQLESANTIVFESSRKIVSSLDPDAPYYEQLPLHDLDVEDEIRLCTRMFQEIRCGKLEQAKNLCINSGHAWRAGLLEGWRLVHNPNLHYSKELNFDGMDVDMAGDNVMVKESSSEIIEGNSARDIWKCMAYSYCKKAGINPFEKAAIAAYCGNLQAIIPVCTCWEDLLWAYMRVLVDIRVESEIRDSIIKKYKQLPIDYWDQKMSLNDVFKYLESSENSIIRKESQMKDHIIQKYIILDEIHLLMDNLGRWIKDPAISSQFLRFAAHLVLFLEQIGQIDQKNISDNVVESYVARLTEMNETNLVAFYVGKLGPQKQVQIYASYLERILDNDERKEALLFGEDSGLNTQEITKQVVENIRNRPHEVGELGDLQKRITEVDLLKISAIDWLLIYDTQMVEAIKQTNALIFIFLTIQKLDAAYLAFNKIPSHFLEKVLSDKDLLPDINNTIKEFLSYKAYLDAHDAFNEWFKQFNSKPIPPEPLSENAQFTEKVAHQHRESQFKGETERWKLSTSHFANTAKGKLYNVLLFPEGGWLIGARESEFLRSTCIPEVVLLLYTVLYKSGQHEECVQLADLLASEKDGLYKVFSKERLGVMLVKLAESSVALLNEKKDAWGNVLVE